MYAIPRKKRKSESIKKSSKLFSEFIDKKEYEKAALIVLWCVFKDFAKEGILNALDYGSFFYKRKKNHEKNYY